MDAVPGELRLRFSTFLYEPGKAAFVLPAEQGVLAYAVQVKADQILVLACVACMNAHRLSWGHEYSSAQTGGSLSG